MPKRTPSDASKPTESPKSRAQTAGLADALGTGGGDRLSDRTRGTVDKGITAIDERIDAIIEKIRDADEYSRDDASHLAWLTKLAASVLTEVRKHDEAERLAGTKLAPELVLSYLRGLSVERRGYLVRELQAMDSSESVLR